jgi:hypothetical protein
MMFNYALYCCITNMVFEYMYGRVGKQPTHLNMKSKRKFYFRQHSRGQTETNGRGNPLRCSSDTLYPQKLALTSPTSGGRSVGIVRLRTKSHGVFFIAEDTQRKPRRPKHRTIQSEVDILKYLEIKLSI